MGRSRSLPALRTMWKNSRAKDCSATRGQQLAESRSSEPSLLGFTALMVVLSDPCTCHHHSQPSWHTASCGHQSATFVNSLTHFALSSALCAKHQSLVYASKYDFIIILPDKQHSSDNRKPQNDNLCGGSLAQHAWFTKVMSAMNWMDFEPVNSHAVGAQAEQTEEPTT